MDEEDMLYQLARMETQLDEWLNDPSLEMKKEIESAIYAVRNAYDEVKEIM